MVRTLAIDVPTTSFVRSPSNSHTKRASQLMMTLCVPTPGLVYLTARRRRGGGLRPRRANDRRRLLTSLCRPYERRNHRGAGQLSRFKWSIHSYARASAQRIVRVLRPSTFSLVVWRLRFVTSNKKKPRHTGRQECAGRGAKPSSFRRAAKTARADATRPPARMPCRNFRRATGRPAWPGRRGAVQISRPRHKERTIECPCSSTS